MRAELHQTLGDILAAFEVPEAVEGALRTTEALVDAAVEVEMVPDGAGGWVAHMAPPGSRFRAGFERPVHRMRMTAVLTDLGEGDL